MTKITGNEKERTRNQGRMTRKGANQKSMERKVKQWKKGH